MIKKYSYGHLMILEISSDQQKRPAGLIKRETGVNPVRSRHCDSCFSAAYHWKIFSGKVLKVYRLKSGDLLISSKRDSCGRREILIKSYNFMCCIYMFDSLTVRFRDGCGSICLFFAQNHRNGQYEKEEKQKRNKNNEETKKERKKRMKKTKRELLVLAAATTVALSMGVTVQAKGDEKVLNFGCQMYTDGCVNSANDENGGWNAMRYGIAEALFKFDDNMEVIPWLAESYEVNDEHTEWTIKLKDGIKFSDGCDLTPTKVKEYFDHMKEVGPSGSAKPEKYLEFEAEVTVDDDANTINIKTSKPYANLVGQLCHPTMGITDVEHIENYDNGIIGTGPYKIEEFNGVGVGYTLAANEYYREDVPYDSRNSKSFWRE